MTNDDIAKIETEIKLLQRELDKLISESKEDLSSNEILILSQKLDKLILKHIELINE